MEELYLTMSFRIIQPIIILKKGVFTVAGITAYLRFHPSSPTPLQLLEKTLQPSSLHPHQKTIIAQTESSEVAFGGTYSRHFQRREVASACHDTVILFYGQLDNDLNGMCEVQFAHHLLQSKGIHALTELNGPFVLFAWNNITQEFFVATDRLGRFPVFYCSFDDTVILTTDLHSVFNAGIIPAELDEASIADFLTIGFPLGEKSMFKNVKRLAGGMAWKFPPGKMPLPLPYRRDEKNQEDNLKALIETFAYATERSLRKWDRIAMTVSGGWDSRATSAYASSLSSGMNLRAVSYGVSGSTDVELGSVVSHTAGIQHARIEPGQDFFSSFHDWAEKVIIHSNGHLTVDLAFQIYVYDRLSREYSAVLDSAGCEFRRGIRARQTIQRAKSTEDVTRFLLAMYSTGVWNDRIIEKDFYHAHTSSAFDTLTHWLDTVSPHSFERQIDMFSTHELWSHHYAYGYPLQTNFIACEMPYSDNDFLDLFSHASPAVRWTHIFHHAVIRRFAPKLERIPICHGHCRVPYGESMMRYLPVVYHRALERTAVVPGLTWLRSVDNWKPFRPYHHWYTHELRNYVLDMLDSETFRASGYVSSHAIKELLEKQTKQERDYSHSISILLTLSHILAYVHSFKHSSHELDR